MYKFTRDGQVKMQQNLDYKDELLALGFELEGDNAAPTLESVRKQLDELDIKYHHKTGIQKLTELLDSALED